MLEFRKIASRHESDYELMYPLYEQAFPEEERRRKEDLERILEEELNFYATAIYEDDVYVGFINFWLLGSYIYVEHFAIVPSFRGKNIGSKLIADFMQTYDIPVVLEVELPHNEMAAKRIAFYERLGFYLVVHDYKQPCYKGTDKMWPMKIMCNDEDYILENYDFIIDDIHQKVYHYFK